MNQGQCSHPPWTDRLFFSLPDPQVRLHDSQLPDRRLHIRDDRWAGRERDHQSEREPIGVREAPRWRQDVHETSQGARRHEEEGSQVVRL